MKLTPLSQLATVSAGQAAPKDDEFSDRGTPFVRAGSLASLLSGKPESELELVGDKIAKLRRLKTYPKGTILFAKSGMSATKDRVYVLQNPAYVVSHLATLIPNGNAHAEYLRLALKRFPPSVLIRDPAYPAISLGDIQSYRIPVPEEHNDQFRIAHLLGKVEGLIAQRKQHLQQFDDLLKGVFLRMFGDPVRNEKEWNKIQFSELLDNIESGKSPNCEAREASADEWGVLKLGAVTRCTFDETENKALPNDVSPSVRDEIKAGDLLFSRKNTYELVAACAYVFRTRPKLLMPDLIFRFAFKRDAEVNPIFMWKLLTSDSQRQAIQSLAAGAAGSMPNISKGNLKAVRLPIPPLPLQGQFAAVVEKIEDIKLRYRESLNELEALYGVLSQQAFRGELDLSRVPLPHKQAEEENAVAAEQLPHPTERGPTITLPDTDNLLDGLVSAEARRGLIAQWLQAYRGQLGSVPFSVQHFMAAAQTRLAELHPETDFMLGAGDYEHIKAWVFEALDAGTLSQAFDDAGNSVELKAVQA